jgi:predicted membrane protein
MNDERQESQAKGCLTALMIIGGLILLFPSACVLLVFGRQISMRDITDPLGLLIIGAAVAGLALIVWTMVRSRTDSDRT